MKMVDDLIERCLEKSPTLAKVCSLVETLMSHVNTLGRTTVALANIVHQHEKSLQELHARQGMVVKAIKSSSIDTKMPEIKTKVPVKPN